MSRLTEAIEAARVAAVGTPREGHARDLVLEILRAAADDDRVKANLRDVPAGRALLRFTDSDEAIEFGAGDGVLKAEPADPKGKGPKVDATGATWLGLVSGTLRPWLAFTRGMVVARAGLTELRWLQQVAERLQQAYKQDKPGA
ncbi:MAG TPA: hypothetical protein VM052_08100 [Candidatus Limnocylindrales bacterium]|nr:hypothetical protein [Candidatus Limnocylindrales bacterium]